MDPVTIIGTGLFTLGAVVWLVCVVVAYRSAPKRGRRAWLWAVLTLVFGPFALFALLLVAPRPGAGGGRPASDPRAELYQVPKKQR